MALFAHITDTHLGKLNFKLEEREKDFEQAFKIAIDKIIEERADFVVHSGDLFDSPLPKIKTMLFVIDQLKRLKEHKIQFYIVPGSHDMGAFGTPISILEKVGLATNLGAERYFENIGEKNNVKGEVYCGCFVAGVPGRKALVKEMYESLKPEFKESRFKIFIFHHITTSINSIFGDLPKSSLPKGFDYYAGGHWHGMHETAFDKGIVVYPGSTEYCDILDMENSTKKGFYIINTENREKSFKELPTRRIEIKKINCNGLTPSQVEDECVNALSSSHDQPICIIRLEGRLKQGKKVEINRTKILNQAGKKRYLTLRLSMTNLSDAFVREKIEVHGKTLKEIENAYLKQQNYSQKEIALARFLIKELGTNMKQKELEEVQKKVTERIWEESV